MFYSPPDWKQMGWLAGRYGNKNYGRNLPTKAATKSYHIGYREGVAERKAKDRLQMDELLALRSEFSKCVKEREEYNGKHQLACLEIERLRSALKRIGDGDEEEPERFARIILNEQ